jgi:hypothetical protein
MEQHSCSNMKMQPGNGRNGLQQQLQRYSRLLQQCSNTNSNTTSTATGTAAQQHNQHSNTTAQQDSQPGKHSSSSTTATVQQHSSNNAQHRADRSEQVTAYRSQLMGDSTGHGFFRSQYADQAHR